MLKIEWPTAENLNQAEIESRKRFDALLPHAVKFRNAGWIARIVREDSLNISVVFISSDKKQYGPVSFSRMVGATDIENLTSFLPF
ncbi:MAG: hypothetical protein LAO55_27130 [Acidobacteriia bacterium]|nr:hypothetical protein [Terriglobia bacterium]